MTLDLCFFSVSRCQSCPQQFPNPPREFPNPSRDYVRRRSTPPKCDACQAPHSARCSALRSASRAPVVVARPWVPGAGLAPGMRGQSLPCGPALGSSAIFAKHSCSNRNIANLCPHVRHVLQGGGGHPLSGVEPAPRGSGCDRVDPHPPPAPTPWFCGAFGAWSCPGLPSFAEGPGHARGKGPTGSEGPNPERLGSPPWMGCWPMEGRPGSASRHTFILPVPRVLVFSAPSQPFLIFQEGGGVAQCHPAVIEPCDRPATRQAPLKRESSLHRPPQMYAGGGQAGVWLPLFQRGFGKPTVRLRSDGSACAFLRAPCPNIPTSPILHSDPLSAPAAGDGPAPWPCNPRHFGPGGGRHCSDCRRTSAIQGPYGLTVRFVPIDGSEIALKISNCMPVILFAFPPSPAIGCFCVYITVPNESQIDLHLVTIALA